MRGAVWAGPKLGACPCHASLKIAVGKITVPEAVFYLGRSLFFLSLTIRNRFRWERFLSAEEPANPDVENLLRRCWHFAPEPDYRRDNIVSGQLTRFLER